MLASSTSDPTDFSSPSFSAAASGPTLTGGQNNGSSLATPTVTLYQYDAADRLTQVVQGAQTRTFVYDGLGRPTSVTTPEARTDSYSYTASGGGLCSGDPESVCQRTDARGVITTYYYSQDALNRLVGKSYTVPQGSNVAAMPNVCTTSTGQSANVCYNYDQGGAGAYALGRRTQMIDPSGSETYTYDAGGRVTQLQKVVGTAQPFTITSAYNMADQVTQILYPSGHVVQQAYDAIGRLCQVATSTTSCTGSSSPFATVPIPAGYDAAGHVLTLNYGNGVSGTFTYPASREQLSALSFAKGTSTLFSLSYAYQQGAGCSAGNDGQIQCISDGVDSGRTENFTYDALGRLMTAATNGSTGFHAWGLAMAYDRYGNRLSQSISSGCIAPMTCPTNSLSFANPGGAQTNQPDGWCFDASGNLLAKAACPGQTYYHDGENKMVQVGGAPGYCATGSGTPATACYIYDGNGTRVQKTAGGTTTVYIYAGSQDIAEYDVTSGQQPNPGAPTREFIHWAGLPGSGLLASIVAGTPPSTTYFHSDHLDWRVSTDANGNQVGQQGHYPFGESWYSTNGNEYVFTSYQRDAETGFDYAMARYYDSTVARFCSADPVGGRADDPQTWNRYTYVRNDPTDKTDPSGKFFFLFLPLFAQFLSAVGLGPVLETVAVTAAPVAASTTAAMVAGGLAAGAGLGGAAAAGAATQQAPLDQKNTERFQKAQERAEQNLDKKDCQTFLTDHQIDPGAVKDAVKKMVPWNGLKSEITLFDARTFDPSEEANKSPLAISSFKTTTVSHSMTSDPRVMALSEVFGHSVYFRPGWSFLGIFGSSGGLKPGNIIHEALHNLLGKGDDPLARQLGMPGGPDASLQINPALKSGHCF